MTTNFERVREFHEVFDCDRPAKPGLPNLDLWNLRLSLIEEELQELCHGYYNGSLVEFADGATDLLYVVYGLGVASGLPMDELFAEVHRSNMSKLDADGNVLRRNDGKVLKSDLFEPPNIKRVLEEAGADV